MQDLSKLEATATYSIRKFAEGQNPETDAPFEIVNKTEVLKGQAALDYLIQIGANVSNLTGGNA